MPVGPEGPASHSSFATGGNHLWRKTCTKGVRLVRWVLKRHLTHVVRYLLSWPVLGWYMSAWTQEGLPAEGTPKLK